MKTICFLSLAVGLGAIAFTLEVVSWSLQFQWDLELIWYLVSYWPSNLVYLVSNLDVVTKLDLHGFAFLTVQLGAPALAILLANSLNRSRFVWFSLSLVFPFVIIILIVLWLRTTLLKPNFINVQEASIIQERRMKMNSNSNSSPITLQRTTRAGSVGALSGAIIGGVVGLGYGELILQVVGNVVIGMVGWVFLVGILRLKTNGWRKAIIGGLVGVPSAIVLVPIVNSFHPRMQIAMDALGLVFWAMFWGVAAMIAGAILQNDQID
ncbi:MAG TPA: hypothetical protein VJ793_26395 [Anaerolineae bacterium]|nr:hypothetical protein [Anaerolineae bacterium]